MTTESCKASTAFATIFPASVSSGLLQAFKFRLHEIHVQVDPIEDGDTEVGESPHLHSFKAHVGGMGGFALKS